MDAETIKNWVEQSKEIIKESPQMDEANTKLKIVEPLIRLLGWNPISTEVELEYPIQMGSTQKKVDYALILEGTPVVFIEVKGHDSIVSDSDAEQLKTYMRQKEIDWGLLTNGERFQIQKSEREKEQAWPEVVSIGRYSLAELGNRVDFLKVLSREFIVSGESEKIAKNMREREKVVDRLREEKEGIAEEVVKVISQRVGDLIASEAEEKAKGLVDELVTDLGQYSREVSITTEKEKTREHVERIGIRIWKGAGPTKRNIEASLKKKIDLENLEAIKDPDLKKRLEEFKDLDEPIYAWADITRIAKKISEGDPIVLVSVKGRRAFLFRYICMKVDKNSEIKKYVGWQGSSPFKKVVFLRDRKIVNLNEGQISKIKELTDAEYEKSGYSGYRHKEILNKEQAERLLDILNIEY